MSGSDEFRLSAPNQRVASKRATQQAPSRASRTVTPLRAPVSLGDLGQCGDVSDQLVDPGPVWWVNRLPPNIIAFDPGSKTGWCAISEDGVMRVGALRTDTTLTRRWGDELGVVLSVFGDALGLVVVEDAFLNPNPKLRNPHSLSIMQRRIGAIIGAASLAGVPSWPLQPSVWQSRMIGRHTRDDGKARSIAQCQALTGYTPKSDHESDAVLLALYARGPLAPRVRWQMS